MHEAIPIGIEDDAKMELKLTSKRKGKKELKENKSSKRWTEILNDKESGIRIMYWDLYCNR